MSQVQFEVCDATKCKYGAETFDVIYSRDTILHIADKRDLFAKFLVSMFIFTQLLNVPSNLTDYSILIFTHLRNFSF